MSKIDFHSTLFQSYLENLKNRIFKILPLIEENNDGISKYTNSLLFELSGVGHVIEGIENDHYYISLLATLERVSEELIAPDVDLNCVRSEVLKCLNIIEYKIMKGE